MDKEIEISPRQIEKAINDLLDKNTDLQNKIDKAIKVIENYNLGKYDYQIPTIGIIELLEVLKGE